VRIAFDYTTGIYPGAGIARYTRSLIGALARLDHANSYCLFYAARGLPRPTPESAQADELFAQHPNFRGVPVPFSVRQMFAVWQRLRLPLPVDLFTGRCDIMHSPDFVSPPHRSGADIITVHDLSFLVVPECADPKLAAFLTRSVPAAVQQADKIIAVSHQSKRDLVRLLGIPESKVVVVHNGVDERFRPMTKDEGRRTKDQELTLSTPSSFVLRPSSFGDAATRLREKLNLPSRFILHVGTLEPRKNLKRLVEAYGLLTSPAYGSHRDIALVLAGRKGWLYEPIMEAAEQVNRNGGQVVFVDYVEDADLPLLYNMAEVFAYPSLYEGFGLPAAEAMSCGTPTLVSTDGALGEVVGDAALPVEAQSTEAIASGLQRLIEDEALRASLAEAGPRQVARFTWEAAAEKVLEVYGQCAKRKM
jgi:glycosyltransferase involved in cell wall biosynthesis